ncbi:hypothetical protein [Parasediminibacterium sp. JCM 36343]|uniref:hypothetical protein n=1 Tax=Parasediminibacterium sp. JCM 36343 TaxID=3374279 RepID=UPI00397B552B
MSYTPADTPQTPPTDNRNIVYAILTILLLGTWGYIIYDKSKTKEMLGQKDTQIMYVSSEKDSIQMAFNNASSKLDSFSSANTKMQGALASQNADILNLKENISKILNDKNATSAELKHAKAMIAELNGKIDGLFAENEKLKGENQQLTTTNTQLSTDKDSLTAQKQNLQANLSATEAAKRNVEDIASTLHASNLSILAIDKKHSGKEKQTSTAKKADFLRFTFDLDENMISPSGTKELYICVTGPDGKPITDGATFTTRSDGAIPYTSKKEVNYEQGKRTPVSFDWQKEDGKYQTGNYTIIIYNNGFKIGEGVKTLKKGGLFS